MKQLIKTSFLLLAILLPATMAAHDFEVGGIYYNFNGNEATVTYKGSSPSATFYEYIGDVTIPSTVTWEGITYPVTAIGESAFSNCLQLTGVTLPNSIVDLGKNASFGCRQLASIVIPDSVTAIGEAAFQSCINLIDATIGNSVVTIGAQAFAQCENLTNVTLGNSVTTIGQSAFMVCHSLSSITIPSTVTTIGTWAFDDCNVGYISVENGNPIFDSRDNCNAIIETATNKLFVGSNHTIIPNTVKTIASSSFKGRRELTSITIPKSITSMGNLLFKDCSSLTSITVESGNPKYDSRENCNAIIETATNKLMEGCVTTIIPSSVTTIAGYAFSGRELTSFTVPNTVTDIGGSAFASCLKLTTITLPNAITEIKGNTFNYCTSLSSVTIPNTVTTIGSGAFSFCSSLQSISIPNSVTTIASSAFVDCSSLKTVTIPNSVTTIGGSAFYDCHSLTDVFCYIRDLSLVTLGSNNVFQDYPSPDYSIRTLHVPRGTLADYQADTRWSNFFGTIVEMEGGPTGDVDGDGELGISDVSALIDLLLYGGDEGVGDVDGDGEVSISDVSVLIDILLYGN